MDNLARIDANRQAYRLRLSAQCAAVDQQIDTFSKKQILQAKEVINRYLEKLKELDSLYLNLLQTNNDVQNAAYTREIQLCIDYNDSAYIAIGTLDEKLQELNDLAAAANTASLSLNTNNNTNNGHSKSRVKIPPAELPKFSGLETEDYAKFIYNLEQVFAERDMKNYEKFLLLRDCLKGKAFDAISGLDLDSNSWKIALQKLEKYFLNTDNNKYRLLDSFNNLEYNYSENIYKYFSKIDNILHAIDCSNIDLNYILQYFLWKALNTNPGLESIFVNITNNPYPDFDTLKNLRDTAISLYERKQNRHEKMKNNRERFDNNKSKQQVKSNQLAESSYAANLPNAASKLILKSDSKGKNEKSNSAWCVLCKGTNKRNLHKMYRCPNYLTSKKKIARLNEMKFSKHTEQQCNFVFHNKCSHCDGRHYLWLCHVNESAKTGEVIELPSDSASEVESENESVYVSESDDEELTNICMEVAKSCAAKDKQMYLPNNTKTSIIQSKVNSVSGQKEVKLNDKNKIKHIMTKSKVTSNNNKTSENNMIKETNSNSINHNTKKNCKKKNRSTNICKNTASVGNNFLQSLCPGYINMKQDSSEHFTDYVSESDLE